MFFILLVLARKADIRSTAFSRHERPRPAGFIPVLDEASWIHHSSLLGWITGSYAWGRHYVLQPFPCCGSTSVFSQEGV